MSWFKREDNEIVNDSERTVRTEGLWVRCPGCRQVIFKADLEANLNVCPKCGHHFRIEARERIESLLEPGYQLVDLDLRSTDPLEFSDLKPYKSNNFNASLEWYFAPRAILSAEVFYKDISNYILSQTVPEEHFNQSQGVVTTYDISRPFNAGSAEVKGFAVAYQQNLPLGFGILANYTFSDGEGQDGRDLPYNSRHQASLSPYFESGPVAIRGTYTWRSKYFTGIDRGDEMYVRDTANVDVSATYNFTPNVGLTLAGMNLTDSEYYGYANTPRLPRSVYRTGRKLLATVNVNF